MNYEIKKSEQPINPIFNADGVPNFGLTKREYFAGLAMQGLLSNPCQIDTTNFEWIAEHAVGYADELLKQLDLKF